MCPFLLFLFRILESSINRKGIGLHDIVNRSNTVQKERVPVNKGSECISGPLVL
jgi:hypothetical protein